MKTLPPLLAFAALAGLSWAQQTPPRDEWYRGLEFEDAASRAELIVAVWFEEVSEIRLVSGGKGESSMQQYRLKPVRVLKGVFARLDLMLASADLGGYRGARHEIKPGQMRLLFLGRSDVGYCSVGNRNDSLDHSMPPLADESDPLLQSVATLLAMRAEPDRSKRAGLLAAALARQSGAAALPLLSAISRRAVPAAQHAEAVPAIAQHLASSSPAVRLAASSALQAILAADYLQHGRPGGGRARGVTGERHPPCRGAHRIARRGGRVAHDQRRGTARAA